MFSITVSPPSPDACYMTSFHRMSLKNFGHNSPDRSKAGTRQFSGQTTSVAKPDLMPSGQARPDFRQYLNLVKPRSTLLQFSVTVARAELSIHSYCAVQPLQRYAICVRVAIPPFLGRTWKLEFSQRWPEKSSKKLGREIGESSRICCLVGVNLCLVINAIFIHICGRVTVYGRCLFKRVSCISCVREVTTLRALHRYVHHNCFYYYFDAKNLPGKVIGEFVVIGQRQPRCVNLRVFQPLVPPRL